MNLRETNSFRLKSKCMSLQGFTLIELLVVILIFSIVTSVALLNVGHNENKKMEAFANELAQAVSLAEEQALLQPVVLGMVFHENSFQFLRFQPEKNAENHWAALDDPVLGRFTVPKGIQVSLSTQTPKAEKENMTEEGKKNFSPQIIFSTNGEVTPFSIKVGKQGQKPRQVIIGDADGRLTRKNLS